MQDGNNAGRNVFLERLFGCPYVDLGAAFRT